MTSKYAVAVVGATGAVGEAMLQILTERKFPAGDIFALASERSAGTTVRCAGRNLKVVDRGLDQQRFAIRVISKRGITRFLVARCQQAGFAARQINFIDVVVERTHVVDDSGALPIRRKTRLEQIAGFVVFPDQACFVRRFAIK